MVLYYWCNLSNSVDKVVMMSKVSISINKRGNDGYKVISVRLKEKTLKKIDSISAQSNRSRNEVVNILLESCIDDVEIN